ncbi:MAG: M20/M25/M40 family metallo-hydrolase [Dehalococcoidia bacterium]|nr:M20/M25/M40 family metallo-hydrolase [Dehalococcoidia bacterium]MDH4366714.1 M20/M25/M40 family metallo-hydrolase [Dehalococcoidia bacterium]
MKYVEVLKDLISINTTVPPGLNYGKAIDYLEPLFKKSGFDTRRLAIPAEHAEGREGRVNLICHRRQKGKPRLILYGHIDVVPAEGWDAFEPRVENGKVYGRGAADMKGSIVALLLAMEPLKGKHLNFDVSVMLTTDEEFSQASQIQYLRQYLEPVAGAHFLNLDSSFGFVSIAGLGALHVDIKVIGKSVHSGLSHLGENAIEKASLLIQALLDLKHKVEQRKSNVPTHPDTKLSRMEGRLNINMIKGGIKTNIVPDECLISVDRRLIPEENLEDAKKELLDTLASVPGVTWQLERVQGIPTVPPADDPIVDRLAGIIGDTIGQADKFGEMGSGDLSHIVATWGCKAFGLGVIRPECNIHGKEEFVYLQDIEDVAKILARFLSPQD